MDPHRQPDRPYGQPDQPVRSRYAPPPAETLYPADEAARYHLGATDPTGHWIAGAPPGPAGRADPRPSKGLYRARRPAMAAVLSVASVVVGLLLVRALAIAAFGDEFYTGGVIASSLALGALPLVAVGLYALVTGAAHGAEQWGLRVWARPPLAYLVVGLAFLTVAGLAVS